MNQNQELNNTKMKKESIIQYLDGATARLHNRRLSFKEEDGFIIIDFAIADKDADKPSTLHRTIKNKIRLTTLKLSKDGMTMLMYAYLEHLRMNKKPIKSKKKSKR